MKFDYKSCTPQERMEKYYEIAKNLGADKISSLKNELNHLTDVLMDEEQVLAFTPGSASGKLEPWLMALTDNRIIFLHKSLLHGIKQEFIDLSKIQTISYSSGVLFAAIDILHGGKTTRMDYIPKSTAQIITNMIQDQINLIKNTKNTEENIDKYEKIEKLYQLKEKGILTDNEFNEEKKKILSK